MFKKRNGVIIMYKSIVVEVVGNGLLNLTRDENKIQFIKSSCMINKKLSTCYYVINFGNRGFFEDVFSNLSEFVEIMPNKEEHRYVFHFENAYEIDILDKLGYIRGSENEDNYYLLLQTEIPTFHIEDRFAGCFEKVSPNQFAKDAPGVPYENIQFPIRETIGACGCDFVSPIDFTLQPGETIKVCTGLRCLINPGFGLFIAPRSGLGFKYRLQLDNTIGVIDWDYSDAENEGHIMIKITNDGHEGKEMTIHVGDRFAQGLIFPVYFAANTVNKNELRNGGMGSTGVDTKEK